MEKKNYLTLDKEFIQYCKLNNIEDIETKANEVFKMGFNILKYGYNPFPEAPYIPISETLTKKKKDSLYD